MKNNISTRFQVAFGAVEGFFICAGLHDTSLRPTCWRKVEVERASASRHVSTASVLEKDSEFGIGFASDTNVLFKLVAKSLKDICGTPFQVHQY